VLHHRQREKGIHLGWSTMYDSSRKLFCQ
jgi:hypothetical protein